jgi:hypothetical protein
MQLLLDAKLQLLARSQWVALANSLPSGTPPSPNLNSGLKIF